MRNIFYVSEFDLYTDGAWTDESGWYVNAVNPPMNWMSNEPSGPYDTLAELREDAFRVYPAQDASSDD
jgi:hypothetical protein